MILHSNFIEILKTQGINPDNAKEQIVLGSNKSTLRFGSIYTEGDWVYDETTGVAVRTTCDFDRDENKYIIIRKYVNDNGNVIEFSREEI